MRKMRKKWVVVEEEETVCVRKRGRVKDGWRKGERQGRAEGAIVNHPSERAVEGHN
jgi:hypothetical protein